MIMTGIYSIKNTITGDTYIGASKDILARWSYHKCVLNKGCHKNYNLQRDYNKYGNEAFDYTIITLCEQEDLIELEEKYTKQYGTYNISIGNKHSDVTRQKMARSHTGLHHSEETKRKISNALKSRGE